jgi:hypothetical protein
MNKKRIFVASSTESLHYAKAVASLIRSETVEPLVWDDLDVFTLGGLTFESIEQVADEIDGAVIIASPDITANSVRGGSETIPRPNVLLELGFFVGRLSRRQIAFCVFDGVSIPSDLNSFTHLPFGKFTTGDAVTSGTSGLIDAEQAKVLVNWVARQQITLPGEPHTIKCHGYSGLWTMEMRVNNWRGIDLDADDSVFILGKALFYIPQDVSQEAGRSQDAKYGCGVFFGKVHAILPAKGEREECNRVFRLVDSLDNVVCHKDGSLSFTRETVSRELLEQGFGTIPPLALSNSPQPWTYDCILQPSSSPTWDFEGTTRAKGLGAKSWGWVFMRRGG